LAESSLVHAKFCPNGKLSQLPSLRREGVNLPMSSCWPRFCRVVIKFCQVVVVVVVGLFGLFQLEMCRHFFFFLFFCLFGLFQLEIWRHFRSLATHLAPFSFFSYSSGAIFVLQLQSGAILFTHVAVPTFWRFLSCRWCAVHGGAVTGVVCNLLLLILVNNRALTIGLDRRLPMHFLLVLVLLLLTSLDGHVLVDTGPSEMRRSCRRYGFTSVHRAFAPSEI